MKAYRLNRLFNAKSNRCFGVTLDHVFSNERGLSAAGEDLESWVRKLAETGLDAIQLTIGQAELLQKIPGKQKPALILRTDVTNVYSSDSSHSWFSRIVSNAVEQAVRLDAACVAVNLFRIPGQPTVTEQCLDNIGKIKADCERWCMPLMIEPVAFRPNHQTSGYENDGDLDKILPLVSQAVELGADIIKADSTDAVDVYSQVIETARQIPVLVRDGKKAPDADLQKRTKTLIQQGAAGLTCDRNIIGHHDPSGMSRALMAIVHD